MLFASRTLISAPGLFNILAFVQLHPCVAIQSRIEIFFREFLKTVNEPETQATQCTKQNSVYSFVPWLFAAFSQKVLNEKLLKYFLCWKYGRRSNHKVNLFKKLQCRWQEATAIAEQTRRKEKWNENIKQENWVLANSSKISYWRVYPHFCAVWGFSHAYISYAANKCCMCIYEEWTYIR